jgi:hypothetical protein
MNKEKLPGTGSRKTELDSFIQQANTLPQRQSSAISKTGRLIFALDATASRQASWDRACQLQSNMFLATQAIGGLAVQLCYYRGFHEFHHSHWLQDSELLLSTMNGVQCLGGYTQLAKTLDHCLGETRRSNVQAVVIIADAIEESSDTLSNKAGQLGMLGTPLFMFQEGTDPTVGNTFKQMAQLSHGAYAHFDDSSAAELADLLKAVATYASGGSGALKTLQSSAAKQLLKQMPS